MNLDMRYYMAYVESHEGRKNKVYLDSNGILTVGVGHKLSDKELKYSQVGTPFTDDMIDVLFAEDCSQKIDMAKKALPNFDSYPLYVRAAIVDGFFRGDLAESPKTLELMRENSWHFVKDHYLNNEEYRQSFNNKTGIWKRMQENASHYSAYYQEFIQEPA